MMKAKLFLSSAIDQLPSVAVFSAIAGLSERFFPSLVSNVEAQALEQKAPANSKSISEQLPGGGGGGIRR